MGRLRVLARGNHATMVTLCGRAIQGRENDFAGSPESRRRPRRLR
jgi:hypothetical protein